MLNAGRVDTADSNRGDGGGDAGGGSLQPRSWALSCAWLSFWTAAAALLALALPACDDDRTDPQHARELPCNLADDECAARPAAADAVAVLEAMGIDPDHTDVQLVDDPHLISGIEPTDDPAGPDALKSEDPTPIGKSSCNGAGATFCCCFWDGPWWVADAPARPSITPSPGSQGEG